MTAGMEALREAARLEAAAFYGRAAGDTSIATRRADHRADDERLDAANRRVREAQARAEIERAWHRRDPIEDDVKAGLTNTEIMHRWGASYREVRDARKRLERG